MILFILIGIWGFCYSRELAIKNRNLGYKKLEISFIV